MAMCELHSMDTLLLIDVSNLLSLLTEVPTLLNKVLNLNMYIKWCIHLECPTLLI